LFGEMEKEVLRQYIWQVAEYCGIQVISYTVMSNHFHVELNVPKRQTVDDAVLLRRYRTLHSRPTPRNLLRLAAVERILAEDGSRAAQWRAHQLAMMGDVSRFMQLLKQRFSIWFNRTHERFGTLWAERYKSVLLEMARPVLRLVSVYNDLNCVRAGLTNDSKEYRFCSYAEAVSGNQRAREGIQLVMGIDNWDEAHAAYRQALFATGARPRDGKASIPATTVDSVIAAGGRLPLAELMRCRIRYLSDGAVLGSAAFVAEQIAHYRGITGAGQKTTAVSLRGAAEWDGLAVMRNLLRPLFGH